MEINTCCVVTSCSQWRKVMALALSPSSIERYVPALEKTIRQGLESWEQRGAVPLLEAVSHVEISISLMIELDFTILISIVNCLAFVP